MIKSQLRNNCSKCYRRKGEDGCIKLMQWKFTFPFQSDWISLKVDYLIHLPLQCLDVHTRPENEVTRLMRISVVRGTQREKTATVTLAQDDLWESLMCMYLIYTVLTKFKIDSTLHGTFAFPWYYSVSNYRSYWSTYRLIYCQRLFMNNFLDNLKNWTKKGAFLTRKFWF